MRDPGETRHRPGGARRASSLFWGPFRSLGRMLQVAVAVVVGFAVVALIVLATPLSLPNPFATETKERPNSVVLAELRDLSRYVAVTGRFTTIVDIEEDAPYLPDFVAGERVVFLAEGDVEAYVDFSGLDGDALEVSEDGRSVVVTLPTPEVGEPRLDLEASRVSSRDRGVVNRLDDFFTTGSPTDDGQLYRRADEKLAEAADQSDLRERAETNTRQFVETLLRGAGYDEVTVVFVDPAEAAASTPAP